MNRLVGASLAVLVCVGGCGPDAGPSSDVAAPSGFRRAVPVAPSAPQAGSAEAAQLAMSITTAVVDEAVSDRRWSPGADRWLRSRVVDDAVAVEMAGVIELHDGFVAWHRFRVDVRPVPGNGASTASQRRP